MRGFLFILFTMPFFTVQTLADENINQYLYNEAVNGNAQAQFELANAYYHLKTDDGNIKTTEWLEKSAAQGYKPAQRMLGAVYYYGLTGNKNYYKARQFLEQSLQHDNSAADASTFHLLGIMFADGLGVRQDCNKALDLFNQAKHKIDKSLMSIGYIYLMGCSGKKDLIKAKEYFGQACDKGDQDGCDEYRKLNMRK